MTNEKSSSLTSHTSLACFPAAYWPWMCHKALTPWSQTHKFASFSCQWSLRTSSHCKPLHTLKNLANTKKKKKQICQVKFYSDFGLLGCLITVVVVAVVVVVVVYVMHFWIFFPAKCLVTCRSICKKLFQPGKDVKRYRGKGKVKRDTTATLQAAATSSFPLVVMEESCDVTDLPAGVTGHKRGMLEQHVHSRI